VLSGLSDSEMSSTRSACEEAMTVLEEVIMFTFQQSVYYLTKVCVPHMKTRRYGDLSMFHILWNPSRVNQEIVLCKHDILLYPGERKHNHGMESQSGKACEIVRGVSFPPTGIKTNETISFPRLHWFHWLNNKPPDWLTWWEPLHEPPKACFKVL